MWDGKPYVPSEEFKQQITNVPSPQLYISSIVADEVVCTEDGTFRSFQGGLRAAGPDPYTFRPAWAGFHQAVGWQDEFPFTGPPKVPDCVSF